MDTRKDETAREYYLREFKRSNEPAKEMYGDQVPKIGVQIVDMMKKEDFTHDQAYASLQYAYNLIQYQSNFLRLGNYGEKEADHNPDKTSADGLTEQVHMKWLYQMTTLQSLSLLHLSDEQVEAVRKFAEKVKAYYESDATF